MSLQTLSPDLREKLKKAAEVTVKTCLGVKPGEKFLVITDIETEVIGRVIADVGWEVGAETIYVVMKPRTRHGEEPPQPIAEMWKYVDVFVAPTKYSLTHTQARKKATELGVRGATMPTITVDIFIDGMSVDYNIVKDYCNRILKALEGAKEIRVTTPLGTDITFSVEGRKFLADTGILTEKGAFGNLPAGEVFVAPLEGTANGVIVFDGAIAGLGKITTPVKVTVKDGFAVKFEGGDEARKLEEILKSVGKKEAFNIAEFGIGTNPCAKIVGNVLMDEKVYKTIHIALGDNSTIGGKVKAGIHIDGIITKPTVYVDGRTIIKDGEWQV
ncbi:MAG: leucyl aminopeptidase [Desulfurococcales archaeon ex4484_42]|nr:MAG: leucyl aminopeptidase [Desulfurococcales archaeon ex4484_42]